MIITIQDVLLRLLTAMLIGLVVGSERERTHRPAGLRTHMLVSLGGCIVMITGIMIWYEYSYNLGGSFDVNRLGAQVVSGVGFLGAGTIIREGNAIKGLTTAASVWACACMGLTAGAGYYDIALLCAACVFITLTVFEFVQHRMPGFEYFYSDMELGCTELAPALETLRVTSERYHASLQELTYFPEEEGYRIYFRARFSSTQAATRCEWFSKELTAAPCLHGVKPQKSRKQPAGV